MYKVLTLNKISKVGLVQLPENNYEASDSVENPDAILLRSFKMHDMELPDSLKAVARCGAGVNNIPLEKCAERGIVVFNTPGANANAVKELVITAMLISSRRIIESYNWSKTLVGTEGVAAAVEKGKAAFAGPEIQGKTLGIIGLGAIGVLVANTAVSLGMKVIGYDPYLSVKGALNLNHKIAYTKNIDKVYMNSDYLTLHVPLNDDTREAINAESLKKMRKGVRIINLARGELVNSDDIKMAVADGTVSCYVTDFPNEKLVGVENIITLPHLGASTPEAEDNCAVMAVQQMMDYLENGNITNSVNFPNCSLPETGHTKVCITHRNMPNVVASITGKIGESGVNIDNMINRSKGDYAYSIIAVDHKVDENVVEKIKKIDGIIGIRIIEK